MSDGVSTYSYDHANRLASVVQGASTYAFAYNGLGDRLRQTINGAPTNYTLDINTGLTQALGDGTNTYLYGASRLAEQQPAGWQYHLGDALGSVRQLANGAGAVTLAENYEPFGTTLASAGSASTVFRFTGEQRDGTGLVFLRARYYEPALGRFASEDTWQGDPTRPVTQNRFPYANSDPVNLVDPSGRVVPFLHPNGYAEGWSVSITVAVIVWYVYGEEVVYDFESMERARFSYTGKTTVSGIPQPTGGCSSLANVSFSPYAAFVFGFNSESDIVRDYRGPFAVGQMGADFPIDPETMGLFGLGGGVFGFSTVFSGTEVPNLDVFGYAIYGDVSFGSGIWDTPIVGAAYMTYYSPLGSSTAYGDDISTLMGDIASGKDSPLSSLGQFPLLAKSRDAAIQDALEWHEFLR